MVVSLLRHKMSLLSNKSVCAKEVQNNNAAVFKERYHSIFHANWMDLVVFLVDTRLCCCFLCSWHDVNTADRCRTSEEEVCREGSEKRPTCTALGGDAASVMYRGKVGRVVCSVGREEIMYMWLGVAHTKSRESDKHWNGLRKRRKTTTHFRADVLSIQTQFVAVQSDLCDDWWKLAAAASCFHGKAWIL